MAYTANDNIIKFSKTDRELMNQVLYGVPVTVPQTMTFETPQSTPEAEHFVDIPVASDGMVHVSPQAMRELMEKLGYTFISSKVNQFTPNTIQYIAPNTVQWEGFELR